MGERESELMRVRETGSPTGLDIHSTDSDRYDS